ALSSSLSQCIQDNERLRNLALLGEATGRVKARLRNPKRWEALWGVIAEERTTREVAEELGMSVAAVGTAANEVLDMLKEEMDKLRQAEGEGGQAEASE